MYQNTDPGLCLTTCIPLPFNVGKIPTPAKALCWELFSTWSVCKEGEWRWEPQHQGTWRPGDSSKSWQPEGPSSFECTMLGFAVKQPDVIWGLWSHMEGPGTMGPRGFLSWQILSIPLSWGFQLNLVQALGMVPPTLTTQARGDYSRHYSL